MANVFFPKVDGADLFVSPQYNERMDRDRSFSADGFYGRRFVNSTTEFGDWNASSMGVSRNGQLAVLASRRGFLVADFDFLAKPKKMVHNNKWEPGSLEWNPHPQNEDLLASVMNQKIEVWNIEELLASGTPRYVLSGHMRAISDINWNYFDVSTLLTCSMDTYINLWDVRQTRKPACTFTTVAGSSQVKWNRKNRHLFASAHDGDVRIWDIRKGNIPFIYIASHLSKIHSLDWSPQNESFLVTASNDCTVKFWNFSSPKQPQGTINNGSPVWKARYTPFGNGLVTVLVPQLRRGGNSLYLWSMSDFESPVYKFKGHTDVILEFQWRSQMLGEEEDYQLVSLSKDQTLKLWRAEKKTVQAITGKYDKPFLSSSYTPSFSLAEKLSKSPNEPVLSSTLVDSHFEQERSNIIDRPDFLNLLMSERQKVDLNTISSAGTLFLSSKNTLSPLKKSQSAFHTPLNTSNVPVTNYPQGIQLQKLQQEFALINLNNPVYSVDLNSTTRVCTVTSSVFSQPIKLAIVFPLCYPDNIAPNFQFAQTLGVNFEWKRNVVKRLKDISQQHVKFNRPCLEPCLRQFRLDIEELKARDNVTSDNSLTPMTPPPNAMQSFTFTKSNSTSDYSYQDSTVPFPRTCGARFCGVGDRLVVFARPDKFTNITNVEKTLRSLSALQAHFQNLSNEGPFDTTVLNETRSFKQLKSVGLVYVSDTSALLPVSKFLAQNYDLKEEDPAKLCLRNVELAESVQRGDLVQMWTLLSKVTKPCLIPEGDTDDMFTPIWACHPFGRKLVESLFVYYENAKDIQTLALMSCVLAKQSLPDELKNALKTPQEENKIIKRQPSTTDGFQVSPEFPYNVFNKQQSLGEGSWSPPTFVEEKIIDPKIETLKQHILNCKLLDPNETFRYDQFKRYYGELLYRWNLNIQRSEVMKYVSELPEQINGVDFCLNCNNCETPQREPYCSTCKSILVKCSVCRVGVRGLLSFCMVCSHGGHLSHLTEWFEQNDWCATGCGCYCLRIGKF